MKRNSFLIVILSLIGLMFTALLFLLTQKPQLLGLNKGTSTKKESAQVQAELVRAVLLPEIIEVSANQTFIVKLSYQNLKSALQASDLLLNFDTDLLEFVSVTSLNPAFINPRALVSDQGYLVLSFVEKDVQTEPVAEELMMADLTFRAVSSGKATIEPILNSEANSSMVIVKGLTDNQLTNINSVSVVIK